LGFVIFVLVFSSFSNALGRIGEDGFLAGILELGKRLFVDNQIGTVQAFRYIGQLEIEYGYQWMQIIVGYIPGVPGSDLVNRVHEYMYGSIRGTVPLAMWASIYHNFGLIGIPVALVLILKVIELSRQLLANIQKNEFWVMWMSFFCFYVAVLPSSEPFQIVNNGLLGLILLFYIFRPRQQGSECNK
jgi:hypothetical protein